MKDFKKEIELLLKTSKSILWVNTDEYFRVENDIFNVIKNINETDGTFEKSYYELFTWDKVNNVYNLFSDDREEDEEDPIEYLVDKHDSIMILYDYHTIIKDVENWRKLLNNIRPFNHDNNHVIIVSPIVEIPQEIESYVEVIDYSIPSEDYFKNAIKIICEEKNIKISKNEIKNIAENAVGLNGFEFENAVNKSIEENGSISVDYVFRQKENLIKGLGFMNIFKSNEDINELFGMDNLISFSTKMAKSKKGRGTLILGVSGTGKTEFAKRLGAYVNRPTISIDFGKMMGSYVGETEKNTSKCFQLIDRISPSIVFVDEIEKGLSATNSNGGDSVGKRQGGQFLKWMQDHNSDTYVIATANDITCLPPEFLRSGRWDAIFFMDIPSQENRDKMLDLYKKKYKLKDEFKLSSSMTYTGAEIENLCKIASNLEIPLKEANNYICPISKTMSKEIEDLRKFATDRCVSCDKTVNKNIRR